MSSMRFTGFIPFLKNERKTCGSSTNTPGIFSRESIPSISPDFGLKNNTLLPDGSSGKFRHILLLLRTSHFTTFPEDSFLRICIALKTSLTLANSIPISEDILLALSVVRVSSTRITLPENIVFTFSANDTALIVDSLYLPDIEIGRPTTTVSILFSCKMSGRDFR
ncbi:hypothetical protein LH53_01685 [Mesotoga sp. TolDC]|nr:hypothetical protein LH53_01685 [Mesotoga sp. TolDC]